MIRVVLVYNNCGMIEFYTSRLTQEEFEIAQAANNKYAGCHDDTEAMQKLLWNEDGQINEDKWHQLETGYVLPNESYLFHFGLEG